MRYIALAALLIMLGPGAAHAAADPRAVLSRMVLIPSAPGAGLQAAPVYDPARVPPVQFDVFLDPGLGGLGVEEYLEQRAQLLAAHYAVWLYRLEDEAPPPPGGAQGPTLVIEPDSAGRFVFPAAVLQPGSLFAWQVVAKVAVSGRSVDLWSSPLYFHTAPAEERLPGVLGAKYGPALDELAQLCARQERAAAALSWQLKGLQVYTNYPTASDTFLCAPLAADDSSPWPDHGPGGYIALPRLIALSDATASIWQLKVQAQGGRVAGADAAALGAELYDLLERWAGEADPPRGAGYATLVDTANSLKTGGAKLGADAILTAANQLLLAIDQFVGPGTIDLKLGYEQAFTSYALASEQRLARAGVLAGLLLVKPDGQTAPQDDPLIRERVQLEQLRGEVQRGRLSKSQLAARLVAAQQKLGAVDAGAEQSFLDGAVCHVKPDRVKRLTAADLPQIDRLSEELARCHLARLLQALFPGG